MAQSPYRPSPRRTNRPIDHSIIQRPTGQNLLQIGSAVPLRLKPQLLDWQKRHDLALKIGGLHQRTTTWEIYNSFKSHGEIVYIEIFENLQTGVRDGYGKITFSPPPAQKFWEKQQGCAIKSANGKDEYVVRVWEPYRKDSSYMIQSPIRKTEFYLPQMKLNVYALHFGLKVDAVSVMRMYTARPLQLENGSQDTDDLSFVVDLKKRKIEATFKVEFTDPRMEGASEYTSASPIGKYHRINKFKFWIPFDQLQKVQRINVSSGRWALAISLESPPQYFRKRVDEQSCHLEESSQWSEFDTWFRMTDIVYDPYRLHNASITLHKEQPVIDIGRWTTYVFVYHEDQQSQAFSFKQMKNALQDYNIEIVDVDRLINVESKPAELWSLIDPSEHSNDIEALGGRKGSVTLPFEVRYQLEVCISHEILNEQNISRDFITTLAGMASTDPGKAKNILEYVAAQEKRVFDPMTIFMDQDALAFAPKSEIPHYCSHVRKANVTPSTIYFSTPTVETTNRVIRHFARENAEGRFLRVQFTDEIFEGRINSCADKQRNDEIFTRVYRTLFNGIRVANRHYKLLAFGNSQFRENGAYFFCETDHLSCNEIRQWMGSFSHIREVARYCARLGQCFSTTRAIRGLSKPEIVKIDDIKVGEHNEYNFTDGVGKISAFLAQMITFELGLRVNTAPSVFQFRLGGCKGVLTVWPEAKEREVHIRPSQEKFAATYNGLEIIRWSRFSACALNRQTITILSALGVPDEVFLNMLTEQLASYQAAMDDNEVAVSLLSRYIDDNQMTINIASMINNGFMTERDPFVLSLLHLWRAWSIKLLKEKAKIIVENGAFLLGCVDETATLRGYTKTKGAPGGTCTEDELPQIFVQVPSKEDENQYNVIEGICLVGRNPSLHPGDIRVVQAVNVPALHHLRDVVVFPQKGDRDIPSMCSGGDLDGDDFFVIWDKNLMPRETNCEPMNYAAPPPKLQSSVTVQDVMKFFVRYMKNDSLPRIALAHLGQSDLLRQGVKDPKCLELAALHSKAVDYVKTGQPAEMPKRLNLRSWPHFMEKRWSPSYHSGKILGQLYDQVDRADFVPKWEQPFDKRILRAYQLDGSVLKNARQVKSEYDIAMRRVMAQQEIATEFEVWSTFVLSRPRVGSDYKVQENMGTITEALKEQFRAACIERAGSKDFSVLGPFVAAMYKVTKEELDMALDDCRQTIIRGGREVPKRKMEQKSMPLISFPWLFEKELGRIATGMESEDDLAGLGLLPLDLKGVFTKKRQGRGDDPTDDFIERDDGVIVHRGEELDLFGPDNFSDGSDDFDEVRSHGHDSESGEYVMGEDGELVLKTFFQPKKTSGELLSGTGVEDVVPRTQLDGFVNPPDPHEAAQLGHNTYFQTLSIRTANQSQTTAPDPNRRGSSDTSSSSLVDLGIAGADIDAAFPIGAIIEVKPSTPSTPLTSSSLPVSDKFGPEDDEGILADADDDDEDYQVEEEEIEVDLEESSFEKAARLWGSN